MTPEGKPHPSIGTGTPSGATDTSDGLAESGLDLVRKQAGGREREKEKRKERRKEREKEREGGKKEGRKSINVYGEERGQELKWNINLNQNQSPTKTVLNILNGGFSQTARPPNQISSLKNLNDILSLVVF